MTADGEIQCRYPSGWVSRCGGARLEPEELGYSSRMRKVDLTRTALRILIVQSYCTVCGRKTNHADTLLVDGAFGAVGLGIIEKKTRWSGELMDCPRYDCMIQMLMQNGMGIGKKK